MPIQNLPLPVEMNYKRESESGNVDPRYDVRLLTTKIHCLKKVLLAFVEDIDALGLDDLIDIQNGISLPDEVRRFETSLIRYALDRTNGHQTRAARLLGLKTTTLNAKVKHYGLQGYGLGDLDAESYSTYEAPLDSMAGTRNARSS